MTDMNVPFLFDVDPSPELRKIFAHVLIDRLRFESTADRDDCRRVPEDKILYILTGMLLHYPEFLSENHYDFIGAMSPQWIQMRNIVSCAFERNKKMPDPLTPDLKVHELPGIQDRPMISSNYVQLIESMPFKKDLDSYLEIGTPVTIYPTVLSSILSNDCCFDVPLINAVVFYVGTQAIDYINSKDLTPSVSTIAKSSHSRFFSNLLLRLDDMGIVILERLAFRPHPWGVLITTVELMKNPIFELFTRDFISSSPEIEAALKPMAQEYELFKITPDMYKVVPDASKSKATTDQPEKAERDPK